MMNRPHSKGQSPRWRSQAAGNRRQSPCRLRPPRNPVFGQPFSASNGVHVDSMRMQGPLLSASDTFASDRSPTFQLGFFLASTLPPPRCLLRPDFPPPPAYAPLSSRVTPMNSARFRGGNLSLMSIRRPKKLDRNLYTAIVQAGSCPRGSGRICSEPGFPGVAAGGLPSSPKLP